MAGQDLTWQLVSVEQKIMRAFHHLQDLKPRVKSAGPETYAVERQTQADGRTEIYTFRELKPPDVNVSVIFGDFINNMAAALNHIAYALHMAYSGIPDPSEESKIAYPLIVNRGPYQTERLHFEALAERHIWGANPEAVALIERRQPYKGGNGAFRWLYELARVDRHRHLNLSYLTLVGLNWGGEPTGIWTDFPGRERLKDGTQVGSFQWETEPDPNMDFDFACYPAVSDGRETMDIDFLMDWIFGRVSKLRDELLPYMNRPVKP